MMMGIKTALSSVLVLVVVVVIVASSESTPGTNFVRGVSKYYLYWKEKREHSEREKDRGKEEGVNGYSRTVMLDPSAVTTVAPSR
jgi:hypothetical protein